MASKTPGSTICGVFPQRGCFWLTSGVADLRKLSLLVECWSSKPVLQLKRNWQRIFTRRLNLWERKGVWSKLRGSPALLGARDSKSAKVEYIQVASLTLYYREDGTEGLNPADA